MASRRSCNLGKWAIVILTRYREQPPPHSISFAYRLSLIYSSEPCSAFLPFHKLASPLRHQQHTMWSLITFLTLLSPAGSTNYSIPGIHDAIPLIHNDVFTTAGLLFTDKIHELRVSLPAIELSTETLQQISSPAAIALLVCGLINSFNGFKRSQISRHLDLTSACRADHLPALLPPAGGLPRSKTRRNLLRTYISATPSVFLRQSHQHPRYSFPTSTSTYLDGRTSSSKLSTANMVSP